MDVPTLDVIALDDLGLALAGVAGPGEEVVLRRVSRSFARERLRATRGRILASFNPH